MRRLKSLLTYIFTIKLVYCGTVSDLINYQLYKDFAMNKGQFNLTGKKSPTSIGGAMNCPIVF